MKVQGIPVSRVEGEIAEDGFLIGFRIHRDGRIVDGGKIAAVPRQETDMPQFFDVEGADLRSREAVNSQAAFLLP